MGGLIAVLNRHCEETGTTFKSSFRDGPKDQTQNLEILRGARGAP
jgi:hypothetical protein